MLRVGVGEQRDLETLSVPGEIEAPGFAPMLYGAVLLAIIAFLPSGIAGLRERFRRA